MKSVAIFQHAASEGPGYLASFLDARRIPWRLFRVDAGDAVPEHCGDFSGLVFMGGPMSVNDDLPWIGQVLALIRCAVAKDIPVLGHCLGGQLMAKALGGVVTGNPVKEIGWGELTVDRNDFAQRLFGGVGQFEGFHWHGETFSLPHGARRLLSSRYCDNQAFVLGKHIGLQCHVEMTADMVRDWYRIGAEEVGQAKASPAVQPAEVALVGLEMRVAALNGIAAKVYSAWVTGLVP
jgi:GMP synthase-like glutamine amidotransferase